MQCEQSQILSDIHMPNQCKHAGQDLCLELPMCFHLQHLQCFSVLRQRDSTEGGLWRNRCGGEQHVVWYDAADVPGHADDLGDQLLPRHRILHRLWVYRHGLHHRSALTRF